MSRSWSKERNAEYMREYREARRARQPGWREEINEKAREKYTPRERKTKIALSEEEIRLKNKTRRAKPQAKAKLTKRMRELRKDPIWVAREKARQKDYRGTEAGKAAQKRATDRKRAKRAEARQEAQG